jgi:hypothetical protein
LIKAAKVEDVEPIWATLFAKVGDVCGDFDRHSHLDRLLKARTSKIYYWTWALEVVLPPPPRRLAVQLLVVMLMPRRRRRRRKKVGKPIDCRIHSGLTIWTEKEESDEDMGFGLFDWVGVHAIGLFSVFGSIYIGVVGAWCTLIRENASMGLKVKWIQNPLWIRSPLRYRSCK